MQVPMQILKRTGYKCPTSQILAKGSSPVRGKCLLKCLSNASQKQFRRACWPRSVCHIRPFIGLPIILLPQPAQLPLIPSSYLSSCTSGCQFPLLYLARRSLYKIITLGGSSFAYTFDQRSSDDLEEELVSNASKKQSRVLPLFFLRSPWYTTQII